MMETIVVLTMPISKKLILKMVSMVIMFFTKCSCYTIPIEIYILFLQDGVESARKVCTKEAHLTKLKRLRKSSKLSLNKKLLTNGKLLKLLSSNKTKSTV